MWGGGGGGGDPDSPKTHTTKKSENCKKVKK